MINCSSTPLLDMQMQNFQARISAGTAQGNLTPQEDYLLGEEIGQLQADQSMDQARGMNPQERAQLWSEAAQINQTIFSLRHNDLGTMGPGGTNARCPQTFLQDEQQQQQQFQPFPQQFQPFPQFQLL